ncbi:MAG: class I SAM-dependent methyltransferase [Bryobacteraceae bacterium]|nr:class I SAM-dependent methyltransferase [Bryobacteraceae bacterium]
MKQADPSPVIELINAFRRSQTMFTAVSLGVFDLLDAGAESAEALASKAKSAEALASATGTDLRALRRLLDGCVGLGLLDKSDGLYANTAVAHEYLRKASPNTLAGYILYSKDALYPMWGHLDDAMREGTPRWNQTFAVDGGIFSGFFRTPQAKHEFLLGMHGFGQISSPAVVRVFNLGRFHRLVDLGGATGHLAIAACERYGSLRGVVFDLPEAIAEARPHVAASSASERIELVEGDFFADALPPADLYALGRIVHDWGDGRIEILLRKIHAALPPGGAILLAETLLDDDHAGPVPSLMQSLNMLVCTEGRERSVAEYRELLEPCGFTQVEGRRTGAPLDAVLAFRKE